MTDTPDKILDVRDLSCPLPVLKTKKAIEALPKGGLLEVMATDPGAPSDIEAYCRTTGNTLVGQSEAAGVYRFLIRHTA